MVETEDLICAFDLLKTGGDAQSLEWRDLISKQKKGSWRWLHFNRTSAQVVEWLRNDSGLPELVLQPLLAEETRPRVQSIGGGHLINLRGVNMNPGSSPEDMVAIRLWVEDDRVLSLRRLKLLAVQDIIHSVEDGAGPKNVGDFLCELVAGLIDRMSSVVIELDDTLDELEEIAIELKPFVERERLGQVRRQTIALKRFLSPQRDAVGKLAGLRINWLDGDHITYLRESLDQTNRLIETLDSIRERANLLQEDLANAVAEKNNRNSYVLAIIAAIFLPLGFLTGLLGINVGGIPGTDDPFAFSIVVALMLVIGVLELLLFKFLRWI